MDRQHNRQFHRLSLRSWENPDGQEGWSIKDRQTNRIIMRGPGETYDVIDRFLGNEHFESGLLAEIDREWPVAAQSHETVAQ